LPCLCAGPLPRTLSRAAIIAVAIIVNVGKGERHAAIVHYLLACAQAMLADATSFDTSPD
jgi:hypothetical protein